MSFIKIEKLILSFFVFSMLCSIASIAGATNQLDAKEKQMVSIIEKNRDASLQLLEQTVNVNSGTMNFAGVKKVGEIFEQKLIDLGFKTHWVDGSQFNRAGHLFASYGLENPKNTTKFLLIGHLDTVFAKDSAFQRYRLIDKNHASGPGTTDMKGGDVVMLSALTALKESGALANMKVKVLLMGDEEKRGSPYRVATKALVDAGKWADIALGFEDGDDSPKTAVIARRGASNWILKVNGRPAHSSQIFREGYGYGAVFEAARILSNFREKLSEQPNLTFNPAVIVGGTDVEFDPISGRGKAFAKTNVIAQSVVVNGDIRTLSFKQLKQAQASMKEIVAANLDKTSASIEFFDGYPPMPPTDGNRKLLSVYNQSSIDLGFGEVKAVDPRKAGAADISFVASYVDMALDGIGLMGAGGHTVKEVADLNTFDSQSKRAALVMYRLANSRNNK